MVVEVMGFDGPDYLAGKEVTYERMESLWDRSTVNPLREPHRPTRATMGFDAWNKDPSRLVLS